MISKMVARRPWDGTTLVSEFRNLKCVLIYGDIVWNPLGLNATDNQCQPLFEEGAIRPHDCSDAPAAQFSVGGAIRRMEEVRFAPSRRPLSPA